MRLVDLDKLDCAGKTQILKVLSKYEQEHPLTELTLSGRDWDVELHRVEGEWPITIRRKQ